MTETKARYVTMGNPGLLDKLVMCSECMRVIGFYQEVDGQVMLKIGGVNVWSLHGNCTRCDAEFHFSSSEKRLERLVERTLRLRGE